MKVKVSLEFGQVRQDWIKHSVKGSRELRQSMGRGCYPLPPHLPDSSTQGTVGQPADW